MVLAVLKEVINYIKIHVVLMSLAIGSSRSVKSVGGLIGFTIVVLFLFHLVTAAVIIVLVLVVARTALLPDVVERRISPVVVRRSARRLA